MRSKSLLKKDQVKALEVSQGYNNLVASLKLIKKHRPFASIDNLPKICQPEDNQDLNFPRSSSSSELSHLPLSDSSESVLREKMQVYDDSDESHKVNQWFNKKPRIGPNFKLQSLNQMLSDGEDEQFEHHYLANERQVNVFNLKDILMNATATLQERMEALGKLKRQATLPAFKVAAEAILNQLV
jgi:tryptophanyl-tRNA synthetase